MSDVPAMRSRVAGCALLYGVLVVWLLTWPATGDGDSALHYLGLRQVRWDRAQALTAWSRPAFVALLALPAQVGLVAARCCAALLTVALVWQTMRMADDLALPHPGLAGFFVVAQPLVFALASDTMTEIPTALALAVATRWWWAGRLRASCVMASFLPLFRPEGFALVAVWGLLVLGTASLGSLRRRVEIAAGLATGMVVWIVASTLVAHNPFFVLTSWPWAARNADKFHPLPLLHHFIRWPYYCGPVLIVLFLVGVPGALRRSMLLPWLAWLVVIGLHSVFAWLGRFEDYGLMRIQTVSAATTALVCLYGWNALERLLTGARVGPRLRHALGIAAASAAALVPGYYYWADADHHRVFAIERVAAFVREQHLVETAPRVFVGDYLALVPLGMGWFSAPQLVSNVADRRVELPRLEALPAGSVGIWDNQQAQWWFGITPDELVQRDFELLYEVTQTVPFEPRVLPWRRPDFVTQRYIVLRKRGGGSRAE